MPVRFRLAIRVLLLAWSGMVHAGIDAVFLDHSATVSASTGSDEACPAYVETTREVIVPLTGAGVARFGEMIVGYRSDWESVTIVRAESRPHRAGRRSMDAILREGPHRSLAASERLESSLREIALLYQGLEVGDTIFVEIERRIDSLPLLDAWSYAFFFEGRDSIARSGFTLRWPVERPLHVRRVTGSVDADSSRWTEDDGRTSVLRWTWNGASPVSGGGMDLPLWEGLGRVVVSSMLPEEISSGLAVRFLPMITAPPRDAAEELLQSLDGDPECIRAWVADSVSLLGSDYGPWPGYSPRRPEETLLDRCGVCRDKALLLAHLLHHSGHRATIALMSASRRLDDLFGIRSFDHVITLVLPAEEGAGDCLALDPTTVRAAGASVLPHHSIRSLDCLPLVPGGCETLRLPDPVSMDSVIIRLEGSVDAELEEIEAVLSIRLTGAAADILTEILRISGEGYGQASSGDGVALLSTLFMPWPECSIRLAPTGSPAGRGEGVRLSGSGSIPLRTVHLGDALYALAVPGLQELDLLGSRLARMLLTREALRPCGQLLLDVPLTEVLRVSLRLPDGFRVSEVPPDRSRGLYSLEWRSEPGGVSMLERADLSPVRPDESRAGDLFDAARMRSGPGSLEARIVILTEVSPE